MKTIVFAIPLVFTAAVVNAQEHTTPAVETGMNFSFTTLYHLHLSVRATGEF